MSSMMIIIAVISTLSAVNHTNCFKMNQLVQNSPKVELQLITPQCSQSMILNCTYYLDKLSFDADWQEVIKKHSDWASDYFDPPLKKLLANFQFQSGSEQVWSIPIIVEADSQWASLLITEKMVQHPDFVYCSIYFGTTIGTVESTPINLNHKLYNHQRTHCNQLASETIIADKGNKASLKCIDAAASFEPNTTFEWLKMATPGSGHQLTSIPHKKMIYAIQNVSAATAGHYSCVTTFTATGQQFVRQLYLLLRQAPDTVQNVSVVDVNETAMLLKWDAPPLPTWPTTSDINSYQISLQSLHSGRQLLIQTKKKTTELYLHNLLPAQLYVVSVAAANSVGVGVAAKFVFYSSSKLMQHQPAAAASAKTVDAIVKEMQGECLKIEKIINKIKQLTLDLHTITTTTDITPRGAKKQK